MDFKIPQKDSDVQQKTTNLNFKSMQSLTNWNHAIKGLHSMTDLFLVFNI